MKKLLIDVLICSVFIFTACSRENISNVQEETKIESSEVAESIIEAESTNTLETEESAEEEIGTDVVIESEDEGEKELQELKESLQVIHQSLSQNVSSLNALLNSHKETILSFQNFKPEQDSASYESIKFVQEDVVFQEFVDTYLNNPEKINFDDGLVKNGYILIVDALVSNMLDRFEIPEADKKTLVTDGNFEEAKKKTVSYANNLIKAGDDLSVTNYDDGTILFSYKIPKEDTGICTIAPGFYLQDGATHFHVAERELESDENIDTVSFNDFVINSTQIYRGTPFKGTYSFSAFIYSDEYDRKMNEDSFSMFKSSVLTSDSLVIGLNGKEQVTLTGENLGKIKSAILMFDYYLTVLNQ